MAFQRAKLKDIIERINTDFISRLTGTSETLRVSLASIFSNVVGGASHLLHGHLDYLSKQINPLTATGVFLELWAKVYGVIRKPATFAFGNIKFTGTDSSIIPALTKLNINNIEYQTDTEVTISGGEIVAQVTCLKAGIVGNVIEGESLSLISPIVGVDNTALVETNGLAAGTNEELDESLRSRLIDFIQNPDSGGTDTDYKNWAKEITGVDRAFVYPNHLGLGTVGVAFTVEDDIIPTAQKVTDVQTHIDIKKAGNCTRHCICTNSKASGFYYCTNSRHYSN